jgi:hypothetical protein
MLTSAVKSLQVVFAYAGPWSDRLASQDALFCFSIS